VARQSTIKRWEAWVQDSANIDAFFALMEGREGHEPIRFRDACMELKLPYMLMYRYVHDDTGLKARYEAVLKALADDGVHEARKIAAEVPAKRDEVAKAKLQVETAFKVASKWNGERYGDTLRVEKSVTVGVDQALLGRAEELLRLASEKVVAGAELVGGEEAPASLPAARPPVGQE
jgi:hypothetical protein